MTECPHCRAALVKSADFPASQWRALDFACGSFAYLDQAGVVLNVWRSNDCREATHESLPHEMGEPSLLGNRKRWRPGMKDDRGWDVS